jgi:hypothetical protein
VAAVVVVVVAPAVADGACNLLPSASAIVTYATDSPEYNVFFWKNVFI